MLSPVIWLVLVLTTGTNASLKSAPRRKFLEQRALRSGRKRHRRKREQRQLRLRAGK